MLRGTSYQHTLPAHFIFRAAISCSTTHSMMSLRTERKEPPSRRRTSIPFQRPSGFLESNKAESNPPASRIHRDAPEEPPEESPDGSNGPRDENPSIGRSIGEQTPAVGAAPPTPDVPVLRRSGRSRKWPAHLDEFISA